MCAVVHLSPAAEAADPPAAFEVAVGLESVEVGPFFSSDGSTLTSEIAALPRASAAGEPGGPETVLWCANRSDPRCGGDDGPPPRRPDWSDSSQFVAAPLLGHQRFVGMHGVGLRLTADRKPSSRSPQPLERPPRT